MGLKSLASLGWWIEHTPTPSGYTIFFFQLTEKLPTQESSRWASREECLAQVPNLCLLTPAFWTFGYDVKDRAPCLSAVWCIRQAMQLEIDSHSGNTISCLWVLGKWPILSLNFLISKLEIWWGAWVAQLAKRPAFSSGRDLTVCEFKVHIGWALFWQVRAWSLLWILCLPLSLSLPCSCCVSLSVFQK